MKIGKFEVSVLDAGPILVDGGAMFGIVPRSFWSRTNPPDELNRISMRMKSLLIRTDSKTILVDTGAGSKLPAKTRTIYGLGEEDLLLSSLRNAGIRATDVTDVILTHLHFDHCGGTTEDVDGAIVPTFPNATVHLQRLQYEWALNSPERDEATFFIENFEPVREASKLHLTDGLSELFPGIELIVVNGHTPGQQLVKVEDESNVVLFGGDLIPLVSQLPLVYGMAYDHWPLRTIEEKKQILGAAAECGWKVCFQHDPEISFATICASQKGFALHKEIEDN